jgi:hypothetical protein
MKQNSIVAFKPKGYSVWYTGRVVMYLSETDYRINAIMPIEPQWYEDGDKTSYHHDEISQIKLLEP